MLLPLLIVLVIFPKTLSFTNNLSLGSIQYPYVAPSPSVSQGSKNGAMQEQECYVARLCEYKIYEEINFSCKVAEYVISQGYERTLPKWLWFDEENKTLKGIPSPSDEGVSEILIIGLTRHQDSPGRHICSLQTITMVVWSLKYIPLFGFAQNFRASPVIDSFSKTSTWQSITCQFNEPIVLATLVFAGNFHEMSGKQKVYLLGELLQSYHISLYDAFILSNREDSMSGLLQNSHVLASGPGGNRSASGSRTTITWHVRCGVVHLEDSLFQAMEKLSQQLVLINNVSYAPIGWHVVSGVQKHHVRKRRNVVGTTTPAYSIIPISRATIITTKIKTRMTTNVDTTSAYTLFRPLPTFSSPFKERNTSLYSQFKTVSVRISQTTQSQYKSVSLTFPVMSLSRNVSAAVSQVSPSSQSSDISQHKSVSTNLPVMSLSNSGSSLSQITSTRQQTSEMAHSTKSSSHTHPASGITRLENMSTSSYLLSSKFSSFTQPWLTESPGQRSTYKIALSSRSIATTVSRTIQSVISSGLFTTGLYLISTSKIHTASQQNNSTTNRTQPSFSSSVSMLSSRTYAPVLRFTSSGITKSTTFNQTSLYERLSSTANIRSILSITASKSTNVDGTTRSTTKASTTNVAKTIRSTTAVTWTKAGETTQPSTTAGTSTMVGETVLSTTAVTSTKVAGTTRSTTAVKSTNVVETTQPSTTVSISTSTTVSASTIVADTTEPSTTAVTSTKVAGTTRSATTVTSTNVAETTQPSTTVSISISTTVSASTIVADTTEPSTKTSTSIKVGATIRSATTVTSTNVNKTTQSTTASTLINVAETTQRSDAIHPSFTFYTPFTIAESSFERSNPTATLFMSCTNSCSVSTIRMNINQTPSISSQQHTTNASLASSIARESSSKSFRVNRTFVLNTTSVMSKTTDPESTRSMITSGIVYKSPQSSEYNNSKIVKTLMSSNTIQGIVGTRSATIQVSSSGGRKSQFSSGDSKVSTFTSLVKPTSTGKTLLTVASQTGSKTELSVSPVSSPTMFSTAVIYTLTEQIKSTYSSFFNKLTSSTYSSSLQRETIQSGSLISNVVPNTPKSSLFTPDISGVISASSSIVYPDVGHSSLSASSTSAGFVSQSVFQSQTNRTLSSYIVSINSRQGSPNVSTSHISSATSLSDLLPPSHHTSTSSSTVTTIPSSAGISSYTKPTLLSSLVTISLSDLLSSYQTTALQSSDVTITPSLQLSFYSSGTLPLSVVTSRISSDILSSYYTTTSSTVATFTPLSNLLSSYHIPTTSSLSSKVTNTRSTDLIYSYKTDTLPVVTITQSDSVSSYITSTSSIVGITTPSYPHLTSSTSSVFTITPTASSSFGSSAPVFSPSWSPSKLFTVTVSSVYLSTNMPTLPSTAVTLTSSDLSSYLTATSSLALPTITSLSELLSSFHTTISLSFLLTSVTRSSESPSSYPTSTSSPNVVTTTTLSSATTSSTVCITTPSLVFLSSYSKTSSSSTISTTIPSDLSVLSSSHITSTLSMTITTARSLDFHSPYHIKSSSSTVYTTTPSVFLFSSYHTSTSLSSVFTSIPLSDFLSSHHKYTSPLLTFVTTTLLPTFQSTHTPTSTSSVLTSSYSSHNLSTSYISISFSSIVSTVIPSPGSPFFPATLSFLTSQESLPTSTAPSYSILYKTFSLPFLSSSIVSSQPSTSADLSMMVHPTVESSISHMSRKSHRTTPVLTHTSMKMPVTRLSAGVLPSSTLSVSSSSIVTLPTTPSKESPKIYNNFDLLRVNVGKVFNVQIPVDTFHDREDGNTRNLRLDCLTMNNERLSSDSWLQFNSTTQTLYGLVLKSQLGETGTSSEFVLTASDHDGNAVYDAFTVAIDESARPLAAMFSVKLAGTNLKFFNRDLSNILSVVQTIANYYGDKDESMIQVLTLTEGSVIFTWSNTSIETCNEELINHLARKIITTSGGIQPYFYNALSPRFLAEEVFVNYTGPCIVPTTANPSVHELSSHETSQFLKYVLPPLVVAVVIVVIAVACLLIKRHSGVKVLKEDEKIFKRRKPVILDGELELSTLSGKPVELPEDSFTPIRFPQETSFGAPGFFEDVPELPSPILPAPYQRLPPSYGDGGSNRYNTPPPPYKLPPSY